MGKENSKKPVSIQQRVSSGKQFLSTIDKKKALKALTIGSSAVTGSLWIANAVSTGNPMSLAKAGVSYGKMIYTVANREPETA